MKAFSNTSVVVNKTARTKCQLLQSATGVFCKVLQAVKVRQFSAIDTARCYLQIVCEQGAAFESTPEAQNLSIIIRRIV